MGFEWNQAKAEEAKASSDNFDALPIGQYRVMINRVEDKPTKDGTGDYLNFELEVVEGPCQNRKLWDIVNYKNKNPKAEEIGWKTLCSITEACFGELRKVPLQDYEGKVLRILTKHETFNGETRAKVKRYMPDGAVASAPATGGKAAAGQKASEDFPF